MENYKIEIVNIQGNSNHCDDVITHIKNKILKVTVSLNPKPKEDMLKLFSLSSSLVIDNKDENYPEISSLKKSSDVFESSCTTKKTGEIVFSIKIKALSRDYQNLFFRVKFSLHKDSELIDCCYTDPIQIISKNPTSSKKRRNSDLNPSKLLAQQDNDSASKRSKTESIEDIKEGLVSIQKQILNINTSICASTLASQYLNIPNKRGELVSTLVSCFQGDHSALKQFINDLSQYSFSTMDNFPSPFKLEEGAQDTNFNNNSQIFSFLNQEEDVNFVLDNEMDFIN